MLEVKKLKKNDAIHPPPKGRGLLATLLKCMRCGKELIIGGNFMLSEVNGENLSEDDDAIVTNASCPYCGASYEIYDTPESERDNYPYWKKKDKN